MKFGEKTTKILLNKQKNLANIPKNNKSKKAIRKDKQLNKEIVFYSKTKSKSRLQKNYYVF